MDIYDLYVLNGQTSARVSMGKPMPRQASKQKTRLSARFKDELDDNESMFNAEDIYHLTGKKIHYSAYE